MADKKKVKVVSVKGIHKGPRVRDELPADLLRRIRLIRAAFLSVQLHSMEWWLEGFLRDSHPEKEVAWWEHLAACYLEHLMVSDLEQAQQGLAFEILFGLCNDLSEADLAEAIEQIGQEEYQKIRAIALSKRPVFDIAEELEPQ